MRTGGLWWTQWSALVSFAQGPGLIPFLPILGLRGQYITIFHWWPLDKG